MSQVYTNCNGLYQNLTIGFIDSRGKKDFKLMSFSCENILMHDDVTIISIY